MSLRDYAVPTETVKIDNKTSFTVLGISFEDLSKIIVKHGPVCVMLYAQFIESKEANGLRPETLGQFISMGMTKFPEAVTDMIWIASGDEAPEVREIVRRLPVGVQIDAIQKIIGLTFTGEADVKKLVELITQMSESVTGVLNELNAPIVSNNGSGSFAAQ